MPKLSNDKIIFDPTVYPRKKVNRSRISRYAEAIRSGSVLPRPKVDRKTLKLVDGLMTWRALELNGYAEIDVDYINAPNDLAIFRYALENNSAHGLTFTTYDHAWIVLRGEELGLSENEIAELIHVTPGFLAQATENWFARDRRGRKIPIKRTIRHMSGQKLTADQLVANDKLSGMPATFHVNQLILLLENGLQDDANPNFKERLTDLVGLASGYLNRTNRKAVAAIR